MGLPQLKQDMLAKVSKMGPNFYVARLLDQPLADFRTRSQARICAREITRFLRRVSQADFVDVVSIQVGIGKWFSRAVTVPGEVVPPPIIST